MSLSSEDWKRINECLLRLYRELDAQKQPRLMLSLLHELVPVDSAVLNYFKPPDQLTAVAFPENFVTKDQVTTVGLYSHQSPFAAYYLATQDATWKMTADFMPVEDFHKLDLHRIALKPLGINQQFGGLLALMDGEAHAITLHRTHRGFTEHERDILTTLQPHLVTSYINALVCSRARNASAQIQAAMETAPGAYGYFKENGRLAWLQDRAGQWLQEFFGNEVKHDGNIPHGIRELLDDSIRKKTAPKLFEKVGENEKLLVCLGISPVGGWVMRLERKRLNPLPRFCPLLQLSKRKNEVLKWMVEGKRNAEIARILYLSPRTVEKHVAEILAALNVENRATAIIRAMEFSAAENQRKNVPT
jgi:DNA-binding CsgD family transcriptional regulator